MKKFLKALLIIVSVIVIVVIGFVSFIAIRGIPKYETQTINLKVESTPTRVAHGKKLASMLCVKCHMDPQTGKLTGKFMADVPKELGEIYSRNITNDKEAGIGNWTDGELAFLLRTGIRRDGHYSPPYMVKLPHASDEDIQSIIAWLHSDDPMLEASIAKVTDPQPSFLVKFLCLVAFKPYEYPKAAINKPDTTNQVEWGKYLANGVYDCYQCHSKDFKTNNGLEPEKCAGFYGGSNPMLNLDGTQTVFTANITPDKATGIGNWTEEDFIKTVKYGMRPNGEPVKYPMEPYSGLDSAEVKAIFAYLKTIPSISNKVVGKIDRTSP